jgi:hypothetical protein
MPDDAYDPYADGDDFEDDGDEFGAGDDDDEEEETEEDGEARPAVFVTTAQAVGIRVEQLNDDRAPENSALATYIDDRLVARSAMDVESIERLLALGLFNEPVPLGLFAYEETPGLQCRLFALVPSSSLREASHAEEPWKASVPSFEDREEDDSGGPSMETILLGHIVRFASDRKHPDDLAAEAVDILQRILTGGPLSDANQKAIDDLLNSL